jgi:hypothetical protein
MPDTTTYQQRMTDVLNRQIAEDLALERAGGHVEAGPRWVHVNPHGVVFTGFRGDTVAILKRAAQL